MEKVLSIVIPAKNESKMIARCIESVITALKNIESWEIIVVDSYSTDQTIDIAEKYPIKILRLKKEWFKSPHAGRYIGTINSAGKYVFFLDADMIVEPGWIETALDYLESDEQLAGVTGVMYDVLPDENINKNHRMKHPLGYVGYLPGPSIYKKEILYQVQHFNPFFKGNGEKELGFRISKAGYRQLRVDTTICYHCRKEYDFDEAMEKASYFLGVGQFLRLHSNRANLIDAVSKYKIIFSCLMLSILFIIMIIVSAFTGKANLIVFPSVIVVGLIMLLLIKQRNPKKSLIVLNHLMLSCIYILIGFFKRTKKFHEYPLEVEIIKQV